VLLCWCWCFQILSRLGKVLWQKKTLALGQLHAQNSRDFVSARASSLDERKVTLVPEPFVRQNYSSAERGEGYMTPLRLTRPVAPGGAKLGSALTLRKKMINRPLDLK
jgi:hypothetical protein